MALHWICIFQTCTVVEQDCRPQQQFWTLTDRYFIGVSDTQSIFNLGNYFMILLTRMLSVESWLPWWQKSSQIYCCRTYHCMHKSGASQTVQVMLRDGRWRERREAEVENMCVFLKAKMSVLINSKVITTLAVSTANPFSLASYWNDMVILLLLKQANFFLNKQNYDSITQCP